MSLPLIVCAILGASSVLLGAYGAHGLVEKFSVFPKMKTAYENAVDYQMYHSLVILVLGVSSYIPRIKMPTYLWGSFTLSIVLFSFPIYIWVLGRASLDGSSHSLGRNRLFSFLALAGQVRLA